MIEQKIQSMRRTIAEIQRCKPGLCLPEKAEETLLVFHVVDQLQVLLQDLEKVSPSVGNLICRVSGLNCINDRFFAENSRPVHPAASDSSSRQSVHQSPRIQLVRRGGGESGLKTNAGTKVSGALCLWGKSADQPRSLSLTGGPGSDYYSPFKGGHLEEIWRNSADGEAVLPRTKAVQVTRTRLGKDGLLIRLSAATPTR